MSDQCAVVSVLAEWNGKLVSLWMSAPVNVPQGNQHQVTGRVHSCNKDYVTIEVVLYGQPTVYVSCMVAHIVAFWRVGEHEPEVR